MDLKSSEVNTAETQTAEAPRIESLLPSLSLDALRIALYDLSENQLRSLLHPIEARLGTASEAVGDFERARLVAHALSNQITLVRLRESLREHQNSRNATA